MKIAVAYDFKEPADIRREGIGVYAKHLILALLEYVKDLDIEVWTATYNLENAKLLFKDALNRYPDRISICTEFDNKLGEISYLIYKNILAFYFLLKKKLYKNLRRFQREKYTQRLKHLHYGEMSKLYDRFRFRLYDKASKAKVDIIYAFFVSIELGIYFKCPKFVQVHDLFTFELFDLFAQDWGVNDLKMHNSTILETLIKYAKSKAIFISSSEYTVREHSLKFIPGITKEQTAVIPFPPLVKDFSVDDILTKEQFKKKYGIWDKYIAIPSQNRPNKNWGVVFRAISRLKQKGINIQFVTTGSVNALKSNSELIENLNIKENILELGSISEKDLYMLYKYEDIAVGSTIIEGMGISGQVIEALKVGNIPAVHSKCHGYIDSLKGVGLTEETADLNWFDVDDDETLAKYMEDILSNPQPHIEKQKHIIDAYMSITWQDVAKKYIELFKKEINKRKSQ